VVPRSANSLIAARIAPRWQARSWSEATASMRPRIPRPASPTAPRLSAGAPRRGALLRAVKLEQPQRALTDRTGRLHDPRRQPLRTRSCRGSDMARRSSGRQSASRIPWTGASSGPSTNWATRRDLMLCEDRLRMPVPARVSSASTIERIAANATGAQALNVSRSPQQPGSR
jgi:hypothetical protein